MPQHNGYHNITIHCNLSVSQITLTKPIKPDNKSSVVGSEAKNPLPSRAKENTSWTDVAGLSWILLDDPLNFGNEF